MIKIIRLIVLASLVYVSAAGAQESNKPVKMGLILPLTGTSQSWGKHMSNAVQLAVSELTPSVRDRLKLIIEDDQLVPAKAISAFKKLTSVDKIDVGVVFGGQSVAAVAPLAERLKVPIFVITANAKLVRGKQYSFRHWLDAGRQVSLLVPYLKQKQVSRVVVVVVSHEAMLEYVTQFEDLAESQGIETVYKEEFSPSDTDFRTTITKIRQTKADAILVSLLPPQISIFAKECKKAQLKMPVYGFSNMETASEVTAAQGSMDGIVYTAPQLDEQFVQSYQDKYNEFPELSAPNVYDMVRIVGSAMENGAASSREIAAHIGQLTDFKGALGVYSATLQNDFTLSPVLKTVKGSKFVVLPMEDGNLTKSLN